MKRNYQIFVVLLFVLGVGTLMIQQCTPKTKEKASGTATVNHFVGDNACKSCHYAEYKDWLSSDHYKAMQPANDSTVEGNFNDKTFTADGVTTHFFKKEGRYFMNTEGEDGKNHDYQIKYTFGYYPLQQYLIAFPGGKLQATRASWDAKNKKWFHQYAGQKIPAHDWLHWTGNAQNWNTMCAACHSTNLQKNYDFNQDTYHTTYSVMTVSCESCHGPGERHITYIKSEGYKAGEKVKNSYLRVGEAARRFKSILAHPAIQEVLKSAMKKWCLAPCWIIISLKYPPKNFILPAGRQKTRTMCILPLLKVKCTAGA